MPPWPATLLFMHLYPKSSNGDWPFQDDYYLTMREDTVDAARGFINWMLSEAGQENFEKLASFDLIPSPE
ncbi:MAG: hypothetical protein Ct9H90mP16_19700 [Candidatus Poseidoniales archaeon]|nr:MAG: hypothetical protein Ct9H90mP16_19700 [Candidatus Poseidoniales archaeon]